MGNTILLFDSFTQQWLCFQNAVNVLSAYSIKDVIPKLQSIESYIQNGYTAAGFISYEAASAFDPALHTRQKTEFPLIWFGIYDEVLSIPGLESRGNHSYMLGMWQSSIDQQQYIQYIKEIKQQIAAGNTYQVNFTYRLWAQFDGSPFSFFCDLVANQKTQYAVYIEFDNYVICSVSPELFFRLEGETIFMQPMKGTVSRGRFLAEDEYKAKWLHESQKNRAENVMIVDMVRNDLGRIAKFGSVKVASLFDVTRFPTVWQMTSSVLASTEAPFSHIIQALFPCASVTGAPKPKTMNIISDLETTPRKIYTGCIGFVSANRKAQFNVAIRTALIDTKMRKVEYGVGGGIVWDSNEEEEFLECQFKARVLTKKRIDFKLLETVLWEPDSGFFLLDYHVKRMCESAKYFDFSFDKNEIQNILAESAKNLQNLPHRLRLLLAGDGKLHVELIQLNKEEPLHAIRLQLSEFAVNSQNPFLFHKTTYRDEYENAKKNHPNCDDILFYNERDEITETTIYNLVFRINNRLFTPPVESGLLSGTFRAWLLEQGKIEEEIMKKEDVKSCDELFVINSVRKWQRAVLI